LHVVAVLRVAVIEIRIGIEINTVIVGRKKNLPVLEHVTIENMGAGGRSVARVNQVVVFVQEALPGDVVDLQVTRKKGRYMEARPVKYHRLSDRRAEPFCAHFGICGGCTWQHLPYEEQLRHKAQQVMDAFRHIAGIEVPVAEPILSSEKTTGYRNKLEYTFSNHRWLLPSEISAGESLAHTNAVGLHVPGRFDKVVDIETCHLQEEPTNQVRNHLRELALAKGLSFYDHRTNEGLLRNVIIRNSTLGEVMVILSVQRDEPAVYELLESLRQTFPELTSLMYTINPKKNEALYDLDIRLWSGRDHIFEKLEDLTFRIGPKSFFQTNSLQALKLYGKAGEYAGLTGSETVYDLYTGTGTLANFLARGAGEVVGIESVPEAIEDARVNSAINGIGNTRFFAGDMKELLTGGFFKAHGKPEVVITDPPRAGMHPAVVEQIIRGAPSRIVYVSCNPATQARDVELLGREYMLRKIQPVDMFPHTHHVENIALLERKY
jgi:23S rRNA (uracil1939-C5)-methyltransferase